MTRDEVYAAAKAEGLELITAYGAAKCTTGFKCVVKADGWFRAQPTDSLLQLNPAAVRSEPDPVTGARKPLHLGRFVTAEEAALEVARALGPVGVAAALDMHNNTLAEGHAATGVPRAPLDSPPSRGIEMLGVPWQWHARERASAYLTRPRGRTPAESQNVTRAFCWQRSAPKKRRRSQPRRRWSPWERWLTP